MTNRSGVGGTLAKYASEGVDVFLLTATRGDAAGSAAIVQTTPASRPAGAGEDPRGGAARRRVGVGRARGVVARLPRPAARSCATLATRSSASSGTEAGSSRCRRDVRARRRLRASGSHRDFSIHDRGHRRRRRPGVCLRRGRRDHATAFRIEALLPGLAGVDLGGLPDSCSAS